MVFSYDPEQGLLRTACALDHTVIPGVLKYAEFWTFLILHLVIKVMFCAGLLAGVDGDISAKTVHVVSAITTLFAVFYSNTIYARYLYLYECTRYNFGAVYDFAFLCKLTFQNSYVPNMRLAIRYFCAAIFISLAHAKHLYRPSGDMSLLLQNHFLTSSELRILEEVPIESRAMRLELWAMEVIVEAMRDRRLMPKPKRGEKIDYTERPEARPLPFDDPTFFCKVMMNSRQRTEEILDSLAMPVPFQYFHILSVMVLCNIGLWCYVMALTYSVFTVFGFVLAQTIFMGMQEVAIQMANPFGDDDVDFPLEEWIQVAFERAILYTETRSPGSIDDWNEALSMQGPLKHGTEASSSADSGLGPDEQWCPPGTTEEEAPYSYSPCFGYVPFEFIRDASFDLPALQPISEEAAGMCSTMDFDFPSDVSDLGSDEQTHPLLTPRRGSDEQRHPPSMPRSESEALSPAHSRSSSNDDDSG